MGASTSIAWTDHTFNPWWGCVKVSPGCTNCYAATFAKRVGEDVWGPTAPRRFFGDAHWREPLKWNRDAEKAGVRKRVFCASMADVFEDRPDLVEPRARLAYLIGRTPNLDWQILTKRPENIARLWITEVVPRNVWLGTTCEDQQRADERIPHLLAVPAAVRFLSVEPMLGTVDLSKHLARRYAPHDRMSFDGIPEARIHWVIVGGESGAGARPFDVAWARSIVRQTREAGVACFVKQMGAFVQDRNDAGFDGSSPHAWPVEVEEAGRVEHLEEGYQGAPVRVRLEDPKGGELEEWPQDLRVREFPKVST